MITTFLNGLDELYYLAKFWEDCTTCAACRCENMLFVCFFCYRQDDAKRQTVAIKITRRPKIRFFAPQGRLVAPIHVKLSIVDVHLGPLGCAKFHPNRHRGWECGPQNIKNFHLAGANRLTDF